MVAKRCRAEGAVALAEGTAVFQPGETRRNTSTVSAGAFHPSARWNCARRRPMNWRDVNELLLKHILKVLATARVHRTSNA